MFGLLSTLCTAKTYLKHLPKVVLLARGGRESRYAYSTKHILYKASPVLLRDHMTVFLRQALLSDR